MLASQLQHAEQSSARVYRASWVVRIDDDQCSGSLGDLAGQVLEVGVPVCLLVTPVVNRAATAQVDGTGPQRIVRARHEDLVAGVEQRLQGHHDELGDPVAEENVVWRDATDAAAVEKLGDCFTGWLDAAGIRIALRLGDVLGHAAEDILRRVQAKRGRVAQVELDDLVAGGLQLASSPQDRSAYVVPDVAQPARLRN